MGFWLKTYLQTGRRRYARVLDADTLAGKVKPQKMPELRSRLCLLRNVLRRLTK